MKTTAAIFAIAALLAAAACSGDDDDGSAASETSGNFCDDVKGLAEDSNLVSGQLSEEQARDAIGTLNSIEPPSDIAEDWEIYVGFLEFAAENGTSDGSPISQDEWVAATERVDNFAQQECGITLPS